MGRLRLPILHFATWHNLNTQCETQFHRELKGHWALTSRTLYLNYFPLPAMVRAEWEHNTGISKCYIQHRKQTNKQIYKPMYKVWLPHLKRQNDSLNTYFSRQQTSAIDLPHFSVCSYNYQSTTKRLSQPEWYYTCQIRWENWWLRLRVWCSGKCVGLEFGLGLEKEK